MESLIAENITKQFDGNTVLDNISFTVEPGEFLSILGPSGCGKTTLLRILIGLLEPDSGKLLLDGRDITHVAPDKRSMGIVFQNYALFENMTVLKNVEYALRLHKDYKNNSRETAMQMLEQVGLTGHIGKYPGELSGGQQQRVAIARTLALSPSIILFDEPMSALDAATRLSLREELKRIQQDSGTTMLYITHDQEEAFALSDRIMVMGGSAIHQLDSPSHILHSPADRYVQEFVIDNLNRKISSLIKFYERKGVTP
jgi:ABC-type Fe3+/spermidine/putrescine transport system ATPase subunit